MKESIDYPFFVHSKFYLNPEKIEIEDLGVQRVEKPNQPNYEKARALGAVHLLFPITWLSGCFGILVIFGEFYIVSLILLIISAVSYTIINSFENVQREVVDRNLKKENEYKDTLIKYKKYKQEIEKLIEINNSPEKISSFSLEKRINLKERILNPIEVKSKKGISEIFFLNKLQNEKRLKEFGFEILINKGIHSPLLENFYSQKDILPYSCDFLIHHKKSNYYFNIEIDEPHTFESNYPIHYVEKNERNEIIKYSDWKRDMELAEYCGWIVLRFAEFQIVNYPQICIDFMLSSFTIFLNDEDFIPSIVPFIPKDFIINRWTFEESVKYSENNFRLSYLSTIMEEVGSLTGKKRI
ncbi:MAG: hypothetical protein KGZ90_09035 [Algoriphagus sp.]|nr:hypothetical protein [Algoriphagus sp.]